MKTNSYTQLSLLYSSIWLCNAIYETINYWQQLPFLVVELFLVIGFVIVEYKKYFLHIQPFILLSLNVLMTCQMSSEFHGPLFYLPTQMYHSKQIEQYPRLYCICRILHVLLWGVSISIRNIQFGQPIILSLLLGLFQWKIPFQQQPQSPTLEETLHIRTASDTERGVEPQLLSVIRLDQKYRITGYNNKAENYLQEMDLILDSSVLIVDKQLKNILNDQFKFSSELEFQQVQQQHYSFKQLLEEIKCTQKFAFEFQILYLKGYENLHFRIYFTEQRQYIIGIQDLYEYKLTVRKIYTQTIIQQLCRSFSHEFNTSLNYILALAQVGESEQKNNQNFFRLIEQSASTMHSVVLDIMDYNSILAKNFSLQVSQFTISDLIQEVLILFRDQINKKNLDLKIQHNCQIDSLFSDRNRIKQILINLVSNAQKFTVQGNIQLKIENTHNQDIIFHVKDTGIGMNQDEQDRLTQLLSVGVPSLQKISNNTAGFGLGLFVSNKIAEVLSQQRFDKGGGLRFNTQQNNGFHAWFTVLNQNVSPALLPNNPKSPLIVLHKKIVMDTKQTQILQLSLGKYTRIKKPQNNTLKVMQELMDAVTGCTINKECSNDDYEQRIKHLRPKNNSLFKSNQSLIMECKCPNILIVDDEYINILALSILLEQFGLMADQVFNGKECVDLIYTTQKKTHCSKCSDSQYKLIFMDINMPLLDGLEASKLIKKRFSPSIIACTAYTDNETKECCYQSGFDYYLCKPVKKDALLQVLQYYHIL